MLVLGISFIMLVRLLIFLILLYSFVDTVPLQTVICMVKHESFTNTSNKVNHSFMVTNK